MINTIYRIKITMKRRYYWQKLDRKGENIMSSSKSSGGLGLCSVLTIVFIVLKLVGVINWSWLWVLSPLWIEVIIAIVLVIIIALIEKNDDRKYRRSSRIKW